MQFVWLADYPLDRWVRNAAIGDMLIRWRKWKMHTDVRCGQSLDRNPFGRQRKSSENIKLGFERAVSMWT
jgi:hypothetical protein